MTDLATLETDIQTAIARAENIEDLEKIRIASLGKKGSISALLKTLGQMSQEERLTQGPLINGLRDKITQAIETRKAQFSRESMRERLISETIDVTLPSLPQASNQGRMHPIPQVIEDMVLIFADMGFAIAEGPDIETDFYNFTALNIPEAHPARQMHDTFYFEPDDKGNRLLLRTHTSPVQIRTMENGKPPFRFIAPGRTYRCDSDRTHTPMFHQIEGLAIDKHIHLGHLKWVLETFLARFFELDDIGLRLRPSYFPFTEPSMEADIQCSRAHGTLQIGKGTDWMEVLGCGMVHPHVLANVGLDPDIWQGFAFGLGVDRLTMLKYGIDDLRAFFDADLRWLKHYGFSPLYMPHLRKANLAGGGAV